MRIFMNNPHPMTPYPQLYTIYKTKICIMINTKNPHKTPSVSFRHLLPYLFSRPPPTLKTRNWNGAAAAAAAAMELIVASSSVDSAIGSWDLRSGSEQLRYRSSASAPHGLLSVSGRFLASSQLRDSTNSSSSHILFWSWDKVKIKKKVIFLLI